MRCNTESLAGEAELFLRRGLDADARNIEPQPRGEIFAHLVNMRRELRPLGDDGHVEIAEAVSGPFKPAADLAQQLHAAVRNIDGKYKRTEISEIDINEGRTIPADPDVRNFSYALVNGQVYYRENSVMTRPVLNQTTQERIKGMIELRDCVRKLIDLQLTDGSDAEIRAQQE